MKTKFCLNCQKDLARNIRIACTDCATVPPFELCVECFAVGMELGEHKKHHAYTVSDCLAFPVVREPQGVAAAAFPSPVKPVGTNAAALSAPVAGDAASAEWTADEELLLLEGIEMFGMGNWKDIAEHVVTKSDKKCEVHYMTAYLGSKDLMPRFLGDPVEETKDEEATATAGGSATAEKSSAGTLEAFDVASSALMLTDHTALRAPPAERSGPSQLAGYMPLRGDFDVEYDNEAEVILADMEFSDEDHPTERELKLKVIEIYNQKLTEREQRKKFVVERGLLDYKLHQHTERKRPKEERELLAQVRPFARFQSPEEHENFVEGLIAAMRLKKQILLLQEYRKNGVRTLAEAELYDAEKKKRELDQALQKQRDNASYLYESGRAASSGRDRANRWQSREQGANGDAVADNPRTRGAAAVSATTASGVKAIAATFSIDGTPGCHLLTPKEKELCSKLRLLPKHYLVIKDALVRECYRLGYLTKKMAKETVQIGEKVASPATKAVTPAKRKADEMEASNKGKGVAGIN
ncbi:hypothetical protein BBJ28_00010807 [Nothophytophthora sp. Chile5]|nr:hypothetical protein BBJ28_00010807 [Nothophytophthora sp. Chile5]